MRACRSIAHLEAFFPFLTFKNDHFDCNICKEYLENITSKQKFLPISYDPSHGIEFSSQNKLPLAFRTLKSHLKRHICENDLHKSASLWKERLEKDEEKQEKVSRAAGFTLGRIAYSNLYRGHAYSDFTTDVLIAAKNGACVGDINHSESFVKGKNSRIRGLTVL